MNTPEKNKTENIGVLFYPSCAHIFKDVFYSEIMEGLEEQLTEANQNLLLAGYDISTQKNDLPKFIREGSVDGVILLGGCPDDFKKKLIDANIPCLMLDTEIQNIAIDSVTTDGFRAMMDMVYFLHSNGHRKIAMFRHDFDDYNESYRCLGFEEQVLLHEIDGVVMTATDNDNAVDQIIDSLESDDPITAACTVNDDMAADIIQRLKAKGVEIPEQISITGFDDTDFSKTTNPPLTTIRINRKQMGIAGAKAILKRIDDHELPTQNITIPSKLVIRDSVKKV
jgi:LacI family transcriptional regulator